MTGFCATCGETVCVCPDTHNAKNAGQTVHCERAQFFTTPSIPPRSIDRIVLGIMLGGGFTLGVISTIGALVLASKLVKALFA